MGKMLKTKILCHLIYPPGLELSTQQRKPKLKFRYGFNKLTSGNLQQPAGKAGPKVHGYKAMTFSYDSEEPPAHVKGMAMPSDLEVLAINSGGAVSKEEYDADIKCAKDAASKPGRKPKAK